MAQQVVQQETSLSYVQAGAYPMTLHINLVDGTVTHVDHPGIGYLSQHQLRDIHNELQVTSYSTESLIRDGSLHFSEICCGGRFISPTSMKRTYHHIMTTSLEHSQ